MPVINPRKEVLGMKKYIDMILSRGFIELPICPHCGNITHVGGKFLPCCGEENLVDLSRVKWLRLVPVDIVDNEPKRR